MCDYSLEDVASRPAAVGDKLVTTTFRNTITRGFAERGKPDVAVCLLPGTEIAFENDVRSDHALGFFPTRNLGENTARFRRVNPGSPHEHHDALEFPSGRIVLLNRLCQGQNATVLQLPAESVQATPETQPETMREAQPVPEPTVPSEPASA